MKYAGKLLLVLVLVLSLVSVLGCDVVDDITGAIDGAIDNVPTTEPKPDDKPDTPTSAVSEILMDFDNWVKVNTGEWEQTADGIKVYGAGVREGHQGLQSKTLYNFEGSETRIKWLANGGGPGVYSAFWVFLMSDYDSETAASSGLARGGFFTTDHSWKESVVIGIDTWYYTRIVVNAGGQYSAVTATGNYDDNGGTVIFDGEGEYENANNGSIVVIFQDNYGGTATYNMVGEATTDAKPTGQTVTVAPTKTLEPQDDGKKTITVYPQEGITHALVNGIEVYAGQDNLVQIDTNQPLRVTYNFVNERGNNSEAIQDLDTYYDFHVLKANGGWASTIHRTAYETDKRSQ
jgi:hypothetical protein